MNSPSRHERGITTLMCMGYGREQSLQALSVANGDIEQAVGYLLDESNAKHPAESADTHSVGTATDSRRSSSSSDSTNSHSHSHSHSHSSSGHHRTSGRNSVTEALRNTTAPSPRWSYVATNGVQELVQMGYPEGHAREALQVARGDINQAVQFLLSGDCDMDYDPLRSQSLHARVHQPSQQGSEQVRRSSSGSRRRQSRIPKMVGTMVSAQSFTNGIKARAFCTVVTAGKFLRGGVVNSEFLESALVMGLSLYSKQSSSSGNALGNGNDSRTSGSSGRSSGSSSSNYDEPNNTIDAKGVLAQWGDQFDLRLDESADTKGGLFMDHNRDHELGIRSTLAMCRNEQCGDHWQVYILETSWESLCICMPPKGSAKKFWLFDMKSRPCFHVPGAYARVHYTLEQLVEAIEVVLRSTVRTEAEDIPFTLLQLEHIKADG